MAWEVACLIVDYFFYCRGRPGTEALLEELAEAHWSFMDGYAEAMIARGPTLTPDRTTWTGSMHMVDLPDAQAARVFAFKEPYYRAGVYGEVLVRRWRNVLGRTMWDFPAGRGGSPPGPGGGAAALARRARPPGPVHPARALAVRRRHGVAWQRHAGPAA